VLPGARIVLVHLAGCIGTVVWWMPQLRCCCLPLKTHWHSAQEVATAIFESILPRSAHDALPASPVGIAVACADRVDSLVGLTAVNALPTASADPFGMRRTVYGLLQTLIHNSVHVSMHKLIDESAAVHALPIDQKVKSALMEFYSKRLEQLLLDKGATH
jgi:glycyl-tRNA synthetase